jgi:hypothetical protein
MPNQPGSKATRIQTRIGFLIGLILAGSGIFGWLVHSTLGAVKVNGPYYQRIVQGKDLIADILTQVVSGAHKLNQLIGEVSSATGEQSKGIAQIGKAVVRMDTLTQASAASTEESASACEELSGQANDLNDMVNTLMIMVKGSNIGHPRMQGAFQA